MAIEIVALIAAAEFLSADERDYVISLADYWNERIEDWTYVSGGPFASQYGVDGYYVRIGPAALQGGLCGRVNVANRWGHSIPAITLIGMEYLHLARLGLRSPDDRRIQNTSKIADAMLRVETPMGIAYHRYNEDGYGEHADGSPYDGNGIGRAWPLLTGERGHFELQLGRDPLPYLEMMTRMTGPTGLIPEQVWDAPPVPERGLEPGKPTGGVMPLVWAHAEFLKLLRARREKRPIELLNSLEEHLRRKIAKGGDLALAYRHSVRCAACKSQSPRRNGKPVRSAYGLRRVENRRRQIICSPSVWQARSAPGKGRTRRQPGPRFHQVLQP